MMTAIFGDTYPPPGESSRASRTRMPLVDCQIMGGFDESALAAYEISEVQPNRYHVTIGKHRRRRRESPRGYEIHYEDLDPKEIGWWEEVPTVKAATAIRQCIDTGTPSYLIRQALERGCRFGRIRIDQQQELAEQLEARDGR